jgi:hypothetical protein
MAVFKRIHAGRFIQAPPPLFCRNIFMQMDIRISLLIVLLLVTGISCRTIKPAAPDLATEVINLPPAPASEIDIPVKINLKTIFAQVEKQVPPEIVSDKWPDYVMPSCDFRYRYRFLRSPLILSASGNMFSLKATGAYQVQGAKRVCIANKAFSPWINGDCGFGNEPMRRVEVGIHSNINLLPNYQLQTYTALDKVNALDKCEVTIFAKDITPEIIDSVRSSLLSYCRYFDNTMATYHTRQMVQNAWNKLHATIALNGFGYLQINPQSLRSGAMYAAGDTLYISMGMRCQPVISSDSLFHAAIPPLPNLQTSTGINSFAVYADAVFEYDFLNRLLNSYIKGKELELSGKKIIITQATLYGADNNKVIAKIDFEGSNKGTVFFTGTPTYDPVTKTFSLPDLAFDIRTRNLLFKAAKWLLNDKLTRLVREKAVYDLSAPLATWQKSLSTSLSRSFTNNIATTGNISAMQLMHIYPARRALLIRTLATGNLEVLVK